MGVVKRTGEGTLGREFSDTSQYSRKTKKKQDGWSKHLAARATAVAGEASLRGTSPTAQRHRPQATGTPCALPLPAVWPVFRRTRLPVRRGLAHARAPLDDP